MPSVVSSGRVADEEDALALLLPDASGPEPRVMLLVEVPVDVAVTVVPAAKVVAEASCLKYDAAEVPKSQTLHRPAVASTLGAVGVPPNAVADMSLPCESEPAAQEDALALVPPEASASHMSAVLVKVPVGA